MPSPPYSPALTARAVSSDELGTTHNKRWRSTARREGAACTIAEECERLFCETLRTAFLGEGNTARQDSLAMGTCNINDHDRCQEQQQQSHETTDVIDNGPAKRSPTDRLSYDSAIGMVPRHGRLNRWIEVWDYVGGARFRGFMATNSDNGDVAMFIFFDLEATVRDLKPGLMALIELCGLDDFECTHINVCLDRDAPQGDMNSLTKDLGWIGFEPVTLFKWTEKPPVVSDKWVFLGMEV